jgi:succinyl-diaminopimelate desuccinylase
VRQDLAADLLVAATAGEEIGMQGAQQIASWPALGPVGAAIIAEPTGNVLGLAERGILTIEFTTHGTTAHGSTPHLGRNAINMMRRLLDAFDRVAGGSGIPFTPHPVLGEPTYSIDTIEGGVAHNVVPDRCVAIVDMRTVPGQDHAGILRQMEEIVARLKTEDPGFDAIVSSPLDLPAVDAPADRTAAEAFLAAAKTVTGSRPPAGAVRFATEAAIFAPALGIPALIFGPGDPALAHQPDEHVSVAKMGEAARIYAAAALALLT